MEPMFSEEELKAMERSAWYYARSNIRQARDYIKFIGMRNHCIKLAMWHRSHAKELRKMRMNAYRI